MAIRLTIHVAPRSKKTSNRLMGYGKRCGLCKRPAFNKVLPSEAYEAFEKASVPGLKKAWVGRQPIAHPINIAAAFFIDADRAVDVHGLYQALADTLTVAGILGDDNRRILASWDGSRVYVDRAHPRIELVITDAPTEAPAQGSLL